MTSPEYHDLAKRAKDTASAAVFITLLLAGITWAAAGGLPSSDKRIRFLP